MTGRRGGTRSKNDASRTQTSIFHMSIMAQHFRTCELRYKSAGSTGVSWLYMSKYVCYSIKSKGNDMEQEGNIIEK